MKTADLYANVTRQIVAQLEAGTIPWRKPWKNGRPTGIMPHNGATGRPYNGGNVLLLWAAREAFGWPTARYMTFKQAQAKGATIRKGEKGNPVLFAKKITVKDEEEDKQVSMMRVYYVFNEAQIDGLPSEAPPVPVEYINPNDRVSAFIEAIGADIRHGGNMAAFVPSLDFIAMPHPHQFGSREAYYGTLLHEHVHWSGAEKRLNRTLSTKFGSKDYSVEELVAELGSCMVCATLEIEPNFQNSAAYLHNWITLLKENTNAIFRVASAAGRAATYLRQQAGETEEGEDSGETDERTLTDGRIGAVGAAA